MIHFTMFVYDRDFGPYIVSLPIENKAMGMFDGFCAVPTVDMVSIYSPHGRLLNSWSRWHGEMPDPPGRKVRSTADQPKG